MLQFYKDNPIDVFLNVSLNEGVPVSIMEAQSFQIPVIATSVGGTSEIVDNNNGLLLSKNIQPGELAKVINDVYLKRTVWLRKRKITYRNWEEISNAEQNYNNFAIELKTLIPVKN